MRCRTGAYSGGKNRCGHTSSFFFFSLSLAHKLSPTRSSPQFPGKDVGLFTGRRTILHWTERPRFSSYITSRSFFVSLVLSFSTSMLHLFFPSLLCVFVLPCLALFAAILLLNNNPSVCNCVWRYFWPLQGHKALSSLLLFLTLSLSLLSAAI